MGNELRRLSAAIGLGEVVGVLLPLIVMAMMGHMGDDAVYLRALYLPFALLFAALQAAIDISNQILTSVNRGAKRPAEIVPTALNVAWIGLAVWGGVVLAIVLAAPWLATLLQVEPQYSDTFVAFIRWMCVSTVLTVPVVVCASTLRGYGRPRLAACVILLSAGLEIAVIAVLGFGTGLGIYALPVGVAAAGVLGLAIALFGVRSTGLWKERGPYGRRPQAAQQLLSSGLPVAMSFIVMAFSSMGLFWVLAPFGPEVVAGYGAAAMLGNLLIVPASALASGAAILMNRMRGAGEVERAPEVLHAAVRYGLCCYGVLAAGSWLGRHQLAELLGGGAEAERYLSIVGLSYLGMGLTVMAVILMEQIGAGAVALLLNIPYFGGIVVAGGMMARLTDDPAGLYTVIAVLNATGLLLTLPILWRVVGRFVRAHRVVIEPETPVVRA